LPPLHLPKVPAATATRDAVGSVPYRDEALKKDKSRQTQPPAPLVYACTQTNAKTEQPRAAECRPDVRQIVRVATTTRDVGDSIPYKRQSPEKGKILTPPPANRLPRPPRAAPAAYKRAPPHFPIYISLSP
jgi:hypothetical protein